MATGQDTRQAAPVVGQGSAGRQGRTRRVITRSAIVLAILILVALGGTSWYFSSQALALAPDRPTDALRILAIHGNTVEVTRTSETMQSGTYNLQTTTGRGITLGAIVSTTSKGVVRRFTGNPNGLKAGSHVHFSILVFGSPAALHLRYSTVRVPDALGPMPAWYIPGRGATWVLIVHGRGGSRIEGMRPLATLARLHLPVLDLSYRNDAGSPSSSDHSYHFGATEWQDLQAGVRYAMAHGARSVVLYGFSMGGSIAESFLHRSPDASRVRAVVLDAPALDWNAVFDFRAGQESVPQPITFLAKHIIAWRLGLGSLDDINYVPPRADFKVRTLLFQGTSDTSVPWKVNATLARARPKLVTYVQVAGAEHTEAWNAKPAAYSAKLEAFLTSVLQ